MGTLIVGGSTEASIANVMAACTVMQCVYCMCTFSFLVHLISSAQMGSSRSLLLELLALNLMYYMAPPLLAFAVYFNLYHSQRHVVRVMQMGTWRASNRLSLMVAITFTVLSTVILGLWYWFGQLSTRAMVLDARPLLRPMFIVISVLTVPHMVLVHEVVTNRLNPAVMEKNMEKGKIEKADRSGGAWGDCKLGDTDHDDSTLTKLMPSELV